MPRNLLVLWRYQEALDNQGEPDCNSIGSHMEGVVKGDRLFITATFQNELYLLALLEAKRDAYRETDRANRATYGKFRVDCHKSDPLQLIPLKDAKWKLEFINTKSPRLNPKSGIAMQVRSRRELSHKSAKLLEELFQNRRTGIQRDATFLEAQSRVATSLQRTRNPLLRRAAKNQWGTQCYCCGLDFEDVYGSFGAGIFIVHHLDPIGRSKSPVKTRVDRVRIVCANCHLVIHRENDPVCVDLLKEAFSARWTRWSKSGVEPVRI